MRNKATSTLKRAYVAPPEKSSGKKTAINSRNKKNSKSSSGSNTKGSFDKYELYSRAVQSPDGDVEFIADTYKEYRGRKPLVLREDFCGTFAISCEWVKLNPLNEAYGVDIDQEPMDYGIKNYFSKLNLSQQKRMHLVKGNVLTSTLPKADISVAVNFSYFIFKQRETMKKYFTNVYKSLNTDGVFMCDMFGGTQCTDAIQDVTKHKGFNYYWDQKGFDPISNEALFHIHFKVGSKKYPKAFTYDWRMWTIPELRELLQEVGFKKTHVYWEGTAKDGTGNGVFTRTEKGEPCLSWIAYLVALK